MAPVRDVIVSDEHELPTPPEPGAGVRKSKTNAYVVRAFTHAHRTLADTEKALESEQ